MAVGGDIIEITYNHPVLGTGVLNPKSGEDNSYFPGGIITSSDENMIDGSGQPIWQKNRRRGYFEAVCVNDQNDAEELQKMIELSAHPEPTEWTFSIANGTVYGGTGKPVDSFEGNINQATFTLRVEGGQFKKIVG